MKIDIISGFLGAGKTTFLNKLLPEINEKIVIIENEYGDAAIDGSLIDKELPVKEIMAGCICCSLVLDFQSAIKELAERFNPDRIIIEPSGVSCLSDVLKACRKVKNEICGLEINRLITVVDASAFNEYIEGFGIFYGNQIENANIIVLSHLENLTEDLNNIIAEIKKINPHAAVWADDWFKAESSVLNEWLNTLEQTESLYQPNTEQKRVIFNAHDVFGSWSVESQKILSEQDIEELFTKFAEGGCGKILRAKGILKCTENQWINFNFTPQNREYHCIENSCRTTGKVAVIGCNLQKEKLAELF